jgi:hypothetical protein
VSGIAGAYTATSLIVTTYIEKLGSGKAVEEVAALLNDLFYLVFVFFEVSVMFFLLAHGGSSSPTHH